MVVRARAARRRLPHVNEADLKRIHASFSESLPNEQRTERHFKIFDSSIQRSPLAIVGLNPGGDPDAPTELHSSSQWFERGEHDYVDCDYPLARKMRQFLLGAGIVRDVEEIRQIPKLNVLFHRSKDIAQLRSVRAASELARPHLAELLREIAPRVLIFEGVKAQTLLVEQQALEIAET